MKSGNTGGKGPGQKSSGGKSNTARGNLSLEMKNIICYYCDQEGHKFFECLHKTSTKSSIHLLIQGILEDSANE